MLPPLSDIWQMTIAEKKKVYGPARIEVGGTTPGAGEGPAPVRRPETIEPVGYHTKPASAYEELDHAYKARAWIDLTCLDETLAVLCVQKRKPFLGFCLTEYHLKLLSQRIVERIFARFQVEGDALYQAELMGQVEEKVGVDADSSPKAQAQAGAKRRVPTPKGPAKRRPRTPQTKGAQRKALAKRLAKLGDGDGDDDDEEVGDDDAEEPEDSAED